MIEHVFPPEMMKIREEQLILALLDCAGICYDINFTQDRILGNPIQVVDGMAYPVLEHIGKEKNCTYTEVVAYWLARIPEDARQGFTAFADRARIQAQYDAGERLLTHRCWSRDVLGNRMLAELKVRLYRDVQNGDLLGLMYISNGGENEILRNSEAKLAAEAAAASSRAAFLEAMSANVPGGYHRVGIGEGFPLEFTSDSFIEIVGWTREEIRNELDNKFINLVDPEDRDRFMSMEPALVRDGRIDTVYRVRRKDGTRRWVQDATVHVTSDGKEYYQCTLADITAFVEQQEEMSRRNLALARERNLMETMERNMPSGYHRCKAEEGCPFLFIGKYFTELLGFTKEEIEQDYGNLFRNLVWPEDLHAMTTYENMRKMRGQGNVYDTSVYRMKHKDGGYRWVTDSTMFVDMGEESFFQGTIADITEHIEELNKARERAEASNQAKSAFLFNASHDIRTPLNAIQGFAHIIEQKADDPAVVREMVGKLKQSSDILLTLMNDVLELSRIERGKETLELRPLNMPEHVQKLKEMVHADMIKSQIDFVMENDIQHPLVMADELKLTRMAMNLLSNARKFTPAGGRVTFGVKESGFDGKRAVYSLYVQDTGIGMSKEFQMRAFEQFERERTATDSGITGSGLGLAIIKSIADLVGGQCSIESELGKGTLITVAAPLDLTCQEDQAPAIDISQIDYSGKRMLLVEDNDFNREIAHYVFEGVGFEVEEAVNGVDCIEQMNQHAPGYYDLIMMDIQMPMMDGYTATQEIRRMANPRKASIPIIAMTANAFEEDKRRCFAAGMDGHIGKPLEADAVLAELNRILKA